MLGRGAVRVVDLVGRARLGGGRGRGLVVQDGHPDQPLGRVRHVSRLQFGRQLPLPLVPPVLEPYFHLSLRQMERSR